MLPLVPWVDSPRGLGTGLAQLPVSVLTPHAGACSRPGVPGNTVQPCPDNTKSLGPQPTVDGVCSVCTGEDDRPEGTALVLTPRSFSYTGQS